MKALWYKIIIFILIVFNVLLVYQNHRLKAKNSFPLVNPKMYVRQLNLHDAKVINRNNQPVSLLELAKKNVHTLFVFFSPSDCPACFGEKELWAQVPKRANIPVYGIATHPVSRELWQWVDNNEIPIPVYLDTTFAIEDVMDFQITPLKILTDSAGRVIWADPPRQPGSQRESFWEVLSHALE